MPAASTWRAKCLFRECHSIAVKGKLTKPVGIPQGQVLKAFSPDVLSKDVIGSIERWCHLSGKQGTMQQSPCDIITPRNYNWRKQY